MEQGSILFPIIDEVPDSAIKACKDFRSALRLCIARSGLERKEVAFYLGLQESHLSRMLTDNPEDNRHFPPDKITELMNITQNNIPLRWLALSRGYGLYRLKSEVELENEQLKEELARQQGKLETIQEFLKNVKGL